MNCTNCPDARSRVIDSRRRSNGRLYRRRECTLCKQRWSTTELRFEDRNDDDSTALVKAVLDMPLQAILRCIAELQNGEAIGEAENP